MIGPGLTYPQWLRAERRKERRRAFGVMLAAALLMAMWAFFIAGAAFLIATAP